MKLPEILKDKRGMAIETALIFMILIFSLCTLLTTLAYIGYQQTRIESITLLRDIEIDQIGEDYLSSLQKGESFEVIYEKYAYSVSDNSLTVWRKTDETKSVVLYVEAEIVADGKISVKSWRYSPPENAIGDQYG